MKTRIALFVLLAGALYAANLISDHHDLNNYWKGAPNCLHNVMQDNQQLQKSPEFRAQVAAIAEVPLSSEQVANKAMW